MFNLSVASSVLYPLAGEDSRDGMYGVGFHGVEVSLCALLRATKPMQSGWKQWLVNVFYTREQVRMWHLVKILLPASRDGDTKQRGNHDVNSQIPSGRARASIG